MPSRSTPSMDVDEHVQATFVSDASHEPDPATLPPEPDIDQIIASYTMAFRSRRKPGANAPRPPNCFLLWRVAFCEHVTTNKLLTTDLRAQNISSLAGKTWGALTDAQKQPWQTLATEIEGLWDELFPGYKYQPAKPKKAKQSNNKKDADLENGTVELGKVADEPSRRKSISTARIQHIPVSPTGDSDTHAFILYNPETYLDELSPFVHDESEEIEYTSIPPTHAPPPTRGKRRYSSCDKTYLDEPPPAISRRRRTVGISPPSMHSTAYSPPDSRLSPSGSSSQPSPPPDGADDVSRVPRPLQRKYVLRATAPSDPPPYQAEAVSDEDSSMDDGFESEE